MRKHWLAYHRVDATEKDSLYYHDLPIPMVYCKKNKLLKTDDIVWMIQGEFTGKPPINFSLVDCFIVRDRITPPSFLSDEFVCAYDAKRSILPSSIEMNKTDPNWIVLHQGFLTKQGNLQELKSSLYTNALKEISGIYKF
jgi:hypothetical protein